MAGPANNCAVGREFGRAPEISVLRERILTACVLLVLLGAALAAPSAWPMLLLLSVMCAAALWEWLRMLWPASRAPLPAAIVATGVLIALGGAVQGRALPVATLFEGGVLPIAVAFWLVLAPATILRGHLTQGKGNRTLAVVGVITLAATWYALAQTFVGYGAGALISLWALIWCADIAAYFVGRRFGRHKLAPRVSPGKTWEGAAGGVAAAVIWLATTAALWPGSYGQLLLVRFSWPVVIVAGLLLAAWSIIGDLFESLLKRRAGVKDSSRLLPGHGGVYDRIDAVLPVAPAALLLLIL